MIKIYFKAINKDNALNKEQNTSNVFYDDEDAADDNLLVCRMVDRRKDIKPYSQPRSIPEVLAIENLRHVRSWF